MNTAQSPKYNSPYPAEIIYTSDKNFDVRIKAMIDREAKDLGFNIWDEKFKELVQRIGEIAVNTLFSTATAANPELLKAALIQSEKMDVEYQNTPSYTAYVILKTAIKNYTGINQQQINEEILKEEEVVSN
jgi:hypothetical protein